MAVTVYKGKERSGLSRRAGAYKDGYLMAKCEVEQNRLIVTDPLNRELYRSEPIAELVNYAVQSIACLRSAQSGKLVVVLGGFYEGSGGQQSLTIATDHAIAEEVRHEEYLAGQR